MAAVTNFRTNLRTALRVKQMSQNELAYAIDTKGPYVNRVLQGHTTPSLDQCEKLAHALGFPLVALLQAPKDFEESVLTATN